MIERTIILDGFSKTYAMTGWRLGYGVMPKPLAAQSPGCMTNCGLLHGDLRPACRASRRSRGTTRTRSAPMVEEFRRRRDLHRGRAERACPGVRCTKPRGAFYVFPNVKALGRPRRRSPSTCWTMSGVAACRGSAFGAFRRRRYLRLSYAASREALERALERMGKALARLA